MRIVVDINYPGHVHLFKNFIEIMKSKGHDILITASEKEVSLELLDLYKFEYVNLGSYGKSPFEKLLSIPKLDYRMYKAVKNFNPDIFLGVGSIRASHVAYFTGKPCIAFEDTEHCKEQHLLYVPFTSKILTPTCFKKEFRKKQVPYSGYHELAYLHPNDFTPNPDVLKEFGLTEDDNYTILRFVSWNASHDLGHHGLSLEDKRKAVYEIGKYGRVLITSEKPLPDDLDKLKIFVSPEKIHDLLYYAALLYGESATMASECAVLGTHAIFCDFAGRGYTDEEEQKYNLVFNFYDEISMAKNSLNRAIELLKNPNLKKEGKNKREILLNFTFRPPL